MAYGKGAMDYQARALVVDVEGSALDLLDRYLRAYFSEIVKCSDLALAKCVIRTTSIDLLIAGLELSGPGYKEELRFLSYVKKRSPGTGVIVVTPFRSKEMETTAYELGVDSYIGAPLNLGTFHERFGMYWR